MSATTRSFGRLWHLRRFADSRSLSQMPGFQALAGGRGDRWHSTDRCHSALLPRKAPNLPRRLWCLPSYPT